MRKSLDSVRGLVVAGLVGVLAACGVNSGGPTGVATGADATSRSGNGGATTNPTTTASGVVRVRCEVRPGRSKISVDGNNLRPQGGTFKARVESGSNVAVSALAQAVGDEVEFDFDSERDDIAAGATSISATFIAGSRVTGTILDAQGNEIVRSQADCEIR
jgi:hypothetical protein